MGRYGGGFRLSLRASLHVGEFWGFWDWSRPPPPPSGRVGRTLVNRYPAAVFIPRDPATWRWIAAKSFVSRRCSKFRINYLSILPSIVRPAAKNKRTDYAHSAHSMSLHPDFGGESVCHNRLLRHKSSLSTCKEMGDAVFSNQSRDGLLPGRPLTGHVIGLGCQRAAHLRRAHWAPVLVAQSYAHLAAGKRGGRRRRQGEFGMVTIFRCGLGVFSVTDEGDIFARGPDSLLKDGCPQLACPGLDENNRQRMRCW
jgi:hypothetical protein